MTTNRAIISHREEITVEHLPTGHPKLSAYRLTRTTARFRNAKPIKGVEPTTTVTEGLALPADIRKLVGGKFALGEDPPGPAMRRGLYGGVIMAVRPAFLEGLRQIGWLAENYDAGVYDAATVVSKPLTAIENDEPVIYVEVDHSCHLAFDAERRPLPVACLFNYIEGNFDNGTFDLDKVVEVLSTRDDVTLHPNGGERWGDGSYIGMIPGYNAEPGRTHCVQFIWHPTVEDYRKVYALAETYDRSGSHDPDGTPNKWLRDQAIRELDIWGLEAAGARHSEERA